MFPSFPSRLIAVVVSIVVLAALAGCGGGSPDRHPAILKMADDIAILKRRR